MQGGKRLLFWLIADPPLLVSPLGHSVNTASIYTSTGSTAPLLLARLCNLRHYFSAHHPPAKQATHTATTHSTQHQPARSIQPFSAQSPSLRRSPPSSSILLPRLHTRAAHLRNQGLELVVSTTPFLLPGSDLFHSTSPPSLSPSLPPSFPSRQQTKEAMAGPNVLTDFTGAGNGSSGSSSSTGEKKQQDVIIIKLGGSSITDKTGFEVGREGGREEGRGGDEREAGIIKGRRAVYVLQKSVLLSRVAANRLHPPLIHPLPPSLPPSFPSSLPPLGAQGRGSRCGSHAYQEVLR